MTFDTIETMLRSVQEEIDDPDLDFKLRTARQLLERCKDENETFRTTVEEADLDEETLANLRQLGYID